jgi:hypothetical protein
MPSHTRHTLKFPASNVSRWPPYSTEVSRNHIAALSWVAWELPMQQAESKYVNNALGNLDLLSLVHSLDDWCMWLTRCSDWLMHIGPTSQDLSDRKGILYATEWIQITESLISPCQIPFFYMETSLSLSWGSNCCTTCPCPPDQALPFCHALWNLLAHSCWNWDNRSAQRTSDSMFHVKNSR